MFTFQLLDIFGAELVAPQANRFVADGDPSLCEYIFDISMAQIEFIIETDRIADSIWRESLTLVYIHPGIIICQGLTSHYHQQYSLDKLLDIILSLTASGLV